MQPAARQRGAQFGSPSGPSSTMVLTGDGYAAPDAVGSIGESNIAKSDRIRGQTPERSFKGAPRSWKVTLRAKLGHVTCWMGVFDGEVFPEGADREDKSTWLAAGQSMLLPIEAGLHFFGNVFDPRAPEALEVIERCGGLELETQKENPGKNAEVRVIGGPIGLPDVIIEPIDGRMRAVGKPIALYEAYEKAWKRKVMGRKGTDPDVLAREKALLSERIAEYTLEDMPLYGADGRVASTAESRAEDAAPSMELAPEDEEPIQRRKR